MGRQTLRRPCGHPVPGRLLLRCSGSADEYREVQEAVIYRANKMKGSNCETASRSMPHFSFRFLNTTYALTAIEMANHAITSMNRNTTHALVPPPPAKKKSE